VFNAANDSIHTVLIRLRADDAAKLLEQRLRIDLAQQPHGLAVPLAPGGEHRQRGLASRRHAQRLEQFAVIARDQLAIDQEERETIRLMNLLKEIIKKVSPYFQVTCLLNISWLLTWQYLYLASSVVIMIAFLITLIILYTKIRGYDFVCKHQ
jgi:hypothetical protein